MSPHSMRSTEHARTVALRQAFGAKFDATTQDEQLVKNLRDGIIDLPPHPVWKIPSGFDWSEDPFGQRNWMAQLHMLRWLDPLRRSAARGHGEDMALWEQHVKSWIAMNPQSSPANRWPWSDMVDAMRAHTLLLGLPYVHDAGWLLDTLEEHAEYLSNENNLGHANHALHQHVSLVLLGSALGSASWTDLGVERMKGYFAQAFDEEGVNEEGAIGYWDLNYRWSRAIEERLVREGIAADFVSSSLEKTALSLAHATRPDGKYEVIGDTAPGGPGPLDSPYTEYVSTAGSLGTPPPELTKVYASGYVFGRSGWGETSRAMRDETFYSLRFGRADAVHGHPDGGAITYFANGHPVLLDSGKDAYTRSEMRQYVLSRLGHNVLHVPGVKYDPKSVVELAHAESTHEYDYFVLIDHGYQGVRHERRVFYSRVLESILCIDQVTSAVEVTAETRWHLNPSASVLQHKGRIEAAMGRDRVATIAWGGTRPKVALVSGEETPFEGWVSTGWNTKTATALVKATRTGQRFRIVTAITPMRIQSESVRAIQAPTGGSAFVLEGRGSSMWVATGPRSVSFGGLGDAPAVLSRPTVDHSAGLGVQPVDANDVVWVERIVAEARAGLWAATPEESRARATGALLDLVRAGYDHGALATLRDFERNFGDSFDELRNRKIRTGFDTSGARVKDMYFDQEITTACYSRMPQRLPALGDRSVHVVEMGPFALPFLVQPRSGDTLVVAFNGALDRNRTIQPRFERARSLSQLRAPSMVIPDPTLDLSPTLGLGWYLGSAGLDLIPELARAVRATMTTLGCQRALLVGSSGGGFAALQLGAMMPEAHALVFNPQTDIRSYHARWVDEALLATFGKRAARETISAERLSVMERYRRVGARPRATYVINVNDGHHAIRHARPFFDEVAGSDVGSEVKEIQVDWGQGHVGPKEKYLLDAVERLL